jgi:hypothetical protein
MVAAKVETLTTIHILVKFQLAKSVAINLYQNTTVPNACIID